MIISYMKMQLTIVTPSDAIGNIILFVDGEKYFNSIVNGLIMCI
jgi:hypothetical protein